MYSPTDQFGTITSKSYKDTRAVLIVYDATSEESLRDLEYWVKEIQYYLPQEIDDGMPVIFVGNKKDSIDKSDPDQMEVNSRVVQKMAKDNSFLKPIQCSAKTGENVHKVFDRLAEELVKRKLPKNSQSQGCCTLI